MTRHKGKPDHQLESIVCREETLHVWPKKNNQLLEVTRVVASNIGWQGLFALYKVRKRTVHLWLKVEMIRSFIAHSLEVCTLRSEFFFFTTGGMKVTIVLICFLLATASPTGERSAKFSHSLPSHARYLTHLTTASGKKNLNRYRNSFHILIRAQWLVNLAGFI